MVRNFEPDAEDEKILDELDDIFGVSQNKETLRDMIKYIKLKQSGKLDFGNFNIIIRNNSQYDLMDNFLKVCAKIFVKYKIISNGEILYLAKTIKDRKIFPFDKINEDIIVISEQKTRIDYSKDKDFIKEMVNKLEGKIFVFEDFYEGFAFGGNTNLYPGKADVELAEIAPFRMSIEAISLDDKIKYCKNELEKQDIKYKSPDLREYADVPFWVLKNMIQKLLIECKSKKINRVDKRMLMKNMEHFTNNKEKKEEKKPIVKDEKSAQEELDELIGLEDAKRQMMKILNYIKVNKDRGKIPSLHMFFTGNPGTGKTSLARIIGKIFEEEKILNGDGGFVEVHGRDLVGKFVGWTAKEVHKKVEEAIGGVLFIDEAYSLNARDKGSFEDEAIATLIKEMEDHRDEICIILAGYTNEMEELIKRNPGFESRIPFKINFPDYSEEELLEIFKALCKKEKYKLQQNFDKILLNNFRLAKKQNNFGNGRYVRNLFEKIKFEQADRIVLSKNKAINNITKVDIENAIETCNVTTEKVEERHIGFCG